LVFRLLYASRSAIISSRVIYCFIRLILLFLHYAISSPSSFLAATIATTLGFYATARVSNTASKNIVIIQYLLLLFVNILLSAISLHFCERHFIDGAAIRHYFILRRSSPRHFHFTHYAIIDASRRDWRAVCHRHYAIIEPDERRHAAMKPPFHADATPFRRCR